MSYAAILSSVRTGEVLNDFGNCVQKVRRMNAEDLLIVFTNDSSDKVAKLCTAMAKMLEEKATVTSKIQEGDFEIKDLDEVSTEQEIFEALQRDLEVDYRVTLECIRSLRAAYGVLRQRR